MSSQSLSPEIEQKLAQIQSQIRQADSLEHAGQLDKALAAYQACLDDAARDHAPISADLITQVWLGIGFCHADRNDWKGALEWYHRAEAITLSTPQFNPDPPSKEARENAGRWTPLIPQGLDVLLLPWDMAQSDLGKLYDSVALAYDNSNQSTQAAVYYDKSATIFITLADTA